MCREQSRQKRTIATSRSDDNQRESRQKHPKPTSECLAQAQRRSEDNDYRTPNHATKQTLTLRTNPNENHFYLTISYRNGSVRMCNRFSEYGIRQYSDERDLPPLLALIFLQLSPAPLWNGGSPHPFPQTPLPPRTSLFRCGAEPLPNGSSPARPPTIRQPEGLARVGDGASACATESSCARSEIALACAGQSVSLRRQSDYDGGPRRHSLCKVGRCVRRALRMT